MSTPFHSPSSSTTTPCTGSSSSITGPRPNDPHEGCSLRNYLIGAMVDIHETRHSDTFPLGRIMDWVEPLDYFWVREYTPGGEMEKRIAVFGARDLYLHDNHMPIGNLVEMVRCREHRHHQHQHSESGAEDLTVGMEDDVANAEETHEKQEEDSSVMEYSHAVRVPHRKSSTSTPCSTCSHSNMPAACDLLTSSISTPPQGGSYQDIDVEEDDGEACTFLDTAVVAGESGSPSCMGNLQQGDLQELTSAQHMVTSQHSSQATSMGPVFIVIPSPQQSSLPNMLSTSIPCPTASSISTKQHLTLSAPPPGPPISVSEEMLASQLSTSNVSRPTMLSVPSVLLPTSGYIPSYFPLALTSTSSHGSLPSSWRDNPSVAVSSPPFFAAMPLFTPTTLLVPIGVQPSPVPPTEEQTQQSGAVFLEQMSEVGTGVELPRRRYATTTSSSSVTSTSPHLPASIQSSGTDSPKRPSTNTTTTSTTSPPRRSTREVQKCRRVYGIEHRDLWCNQCKWKKACRRFSSDSTS